MNRFLLTFFVGTTLVALMLLLSRNMFLVESGCSYGNVKGGNFDPLCKEWWQKAYEYDQQRAKRAECIKLIQQKCPHLIKVETTVTREYSLDRPRNDIWKTEVRSSRTDVPERPMKYYTTEYKPLCFDDNDKISDCDYWWTGVKNDDAKDKHREYCTEQILEHCGRDIEKIRENSVCQVQKCLRGYEVREVMYRYKEETAIIKIYVPLQKGKEE